MPNARTSWAAVARSTPSSSAARPPSPLARRGCRLAGPPRRASRSSGPSWRTSDLAEQVAQAADVGAQRRVRVALDAVGRRGCSTVAACRRQPRPDDRRRHGARRCDRDPRLSAGRRTLESDPRPLCGPGLLCCPRPRPRRPDTREPDRPARRPARRACRRPRAAHGGARRALPAARAPTSTSRRRPACGRSSLAALAGRAGRPVLAVTATGREAEDLAAALRGLLDPRPVVELPGWETLPHERLSPRSDTVGRRLAVLRRLAHPDARRRRARPGRGRRRAGARLLQPHGRRPRRPRAGRAARRRRGRPRRRRRAAGGGRLHPGRPGRAARRVRRARRHPRRLPADRGAPAAGRVLGRHGRGGALVQGRRPALASRSPSTGCGRRRAASCCSPTRCARGPRALADDAPRAGRHARQDRRGHRGRGHGGARARCSSTTWSCWSTSCRPAPHVVVLRPRAGPHPGARPGRDQPGVPRGLLGTRPPAAATPIDLGAAALPHPGRRPRTPRSSSACRGGRVSPFAADEDADDEDDARSLARARRRGATAATPSARSPTSRAGSATAGASCCITEGHGPAQRLVELLGGEDIPARLGRRRSTRRPSPASSHVTTGRLDRGFVSERCGSPCSPRPT